jgi:hypothetical protein
MGQSWIPVHTIRPILLEGKAGRSSQSMIPSRMKEWMGEMAERDERSEAAKRWVTVNMVEYERQQAELARERRLRRELDPWNLGIYDVEPFHKV